MCPALGERMRKTIILIVFLVTLLGAVGQSKPIAGLVTFEGGTASFPVIVHVELEDKRICIIKPSSITGTDGSFATNLENLVLQEFPAVRCNGLWNAGNRIWYEVTSNQGTVSSQALELQSGTGLQMLTPISIAVKGGAASLPMGGGGGSGATRAPDLNGSEPVTLPNSKYPTLQLDSQITNNEIIAVVKGNGEMGGMLRVVLYRLPDDTQVMYQEFSITMFPFEQEVRFKVKDIEAGLYKVQAFFFVEDVLQSVSAYDTFTIRKEDLEIKKDNFAGLAMYAKSTVVDSLSGKYTAMWAYLIAGVLIFIALILFIYKRRHYSREITIKEIK